MNVGTRLTRSGALKGIRTLDDVVDAYLLHFDYRSSIERGEGHHDPVVDYCENAKNMREAIERAVEGKRSDGKMFSEGSCVRASSKIEFERNLKNIAATFQEKDFDSLYDLIREQRSWGIGDLTTYNVTARLAAYLGSRPSRYVYLHAGPLAAWKRLTGEKGKRYRVLYSEMPKAFQRLESHRIEDLLCEMRELLHPGMMP